jgi:hypothetical protein
MTALEATMAAVVDRGPQDWAILAVFATVYLGMFLGGLPHFRSWTAPGWRCWAPSR